jgi:YfiH family protein
VNLYQVDLDFSPAAGLYAEFPLMFDGEPVKGVRGFVSSRAAGDMGLVNGAPGPTRQELLRTLGAEQGFDPALVYAATQVHSRQVREVDRAAPNTVPEADGMITAGRALTLAVTVADCLPVYLYDTKSGGRALVHSGWKGTGIAGAALRLMAERWGTRGADVAALLGPCIQSCCYQVDEDRARSFEAEFGGSGGEWPLGPVVLRGDAVPGNAGRLASGASGVSLALQAANARLLAAAGVRHLAVCRACTYTDGRLGSFRREGPASYTKMIALFPGNGRPGLDY